MPYFIPPLFYLVLADKSTAPGGEVVMGGHRTRGGIGITRRGEIGKNQKTGPRPVSPRAADANFCTITIVAVYSDSDDDDDNNSAEQKGHYMRGTASYLYSHGRTAARPSSPRAKIL